MADLHLHIISPEKVLVDVKVDKVLLPGTQAPFQVLCGHAPLLSSLKEGKIVYDSKGEKKELTIKSGFAQVEDDEVSVCVEV